MLEHAPETGGVQRVPVHDEISGITQEAVERIGQITGHLLHPGFTRLSRNTDDLDLSRFKAYREQDVVTNDSRECKYLDVKEVETGQDFPMCIQKGLPWHLPLALRCGFDAMVIEYAFYCVSVHGNPKIEQRIPDPGVSSRLVLVSNFYDKIGNSISFSWPSRPSFSRTVVFSGNEGPEPTQQRFRCDNSRELFEGFTSQCFGFHAQPTPLLVSESEPMAFAEFLVHPDLFDEIVNDLLLISVDPADCEQDEEA